MFSKTFLDTTNQKVVQKNSKTPVEPQVQERENRSIEAQSNGTKRVTSERNQETLAKI